MKDGTRGWMPVKLLRSQLIDVPGDYLVTPIGENKIVIYTADRKKEMGSIDLVEEKIKMKETV